MPLAANPLLQTPATVAAKAAAANAAQPAAEPTKTGAQHFSKVYAKASQANTPNLAEKGIKPARDKTPDPVFKRDVGQNNPPGKSSVADSGKALPNGKNKDNVSAEQSDSTANPAANASTVDSTAAAPAVPPTAPVVDPQPETVAVEPEVQAPQLAAAANAATTPLMSAQPGVDEHFDPEADPLDDLPAVRLAMEQGGHVSASSQSPIKTSASENTAAPIQGQASGIALLIDADADGKTAGEGGEKTFKGLVDDGLKDLKSASSDTRVDDFANRLAALTQAAVPKTSNALPVNQPLAMHQSGWSEEVVNRVMYLSSANLKTADIQLEPAELGRLDIRVNMAADQPAQVSFVSGHAGVREALEGQMFRLREMFAQQGMGQVDVNVSDQSRQWQGQGQAPDQQGRDQANGTARGMRLEAAGEEDVGAAGVEQAAPSVVLGSSAVDYYA